MAPKDVIFNGAKFVPNNYSAILSKDEAPSELHFIQDFLANSDIGYTLTQPDAVSETQVLEFWRSGVYDDGGAQGLGYEKTLEKLGQLNRPYIRREWSFFFDCIIKAFANKCSNFDAIHIFSQQIGYALINQTDFDYASAILGFIGDRMTEDRNTVYFARFCQLIYSFCYDDKPQSASELITSFRLAKRAFNDLLSTDNKKVVLRPLRVPLSVKQALITYDPVKYTALYPDVQSLEPQPSTPTTSTQTPQTSHPSAQTTKPSSSKPSKRTKSVPQPPQKRRKMTLRDESESEEETIEARVRASEPVTDVAENVTSQKETTAQSSDTLKRKKSVSFVAAEATPSLARRLKKMKARRYLAKAPSEDTEEAEEGDQESLISQVPVIIEALPAQAKDTTNHTVVTPHVSPIKAIDDAKEQTENSEIDIHNLNIPEVLYLEAPSPSKTLALDLNSDPQNLDDHESTLSSDYSVSAEHPVPILGKEELVKKFVEKEAPIPWEDTHRGVEWTKKWNESDFIPYSKVLTEHIAKADELFTNDDFKTQLKITTLSTEHLQGVHTSTHEKAQIAEVLANQASQKAQLDEIQSSVELLLSLLLPDDAKKGEKVVKSKCSPTYELKKKGDKGDEQGNSERAESGSEDSQKFLQTLKLKGKQTTVYYKNPKIQTLDEEIARRLFLKHNPGMDLETLKEKEAKFGAEKTNLKSKASDAKKPPRPKEKGIVIKEKSNSETSKFKTISQTESDPKDKGKGKVYEPTKPLDLKTSQDLMKPVCKMVQVTDDNLVEDETVQILKRIKIIEESKTTSDTAQVVIQNKEQQGTEETTNYDQAIKTSTTDNAQVDLKKMTIADKKMLLWKKAIPVELKSNLMIN
ncbi:hypothetical protein AgCh_009513 [Apium graveolens]